MNAQEKVLEYASENNSGDTYTDQQLAGKMFAEGATISRNGNTRVEAKISREGQEIVITETTINTNWFNTKTNRAEEKAETVEVMRFSI